MDVYLATVKNYFASDMRILLSGGAVFVQDGSSPRKSMAAKERLSSRDTRALPWPANIPDVAPLDYGACEIPQADVEKETPKTAVDLLAAVRCACDTLRLEAIRRPVGDFPHRLVCARSGGMRVFHLSRAQE